MAEAFSRAVSPRLRTGTYVERGGKTYVIDNAGRECRVTYHCHGKGGVEYSGSRKDCPLCPKVKAI